MVSIQRNYISLSLSPLPQNPFGDLTPYQQKYCRICLFLGFGTLENLSRSTLMKTWLNIDDEKIYLSVLSRASKVAFI